MNQLTDKRVAEILARAEICDDSVLTDYADIVLAMRELQEHRKAAGVTQNSRSSEKVQVVQSVDHVGRVNVNYSKLSNGEISVLLARLLKPKYEADIHPHDDHGAQLSWDWFGTRHTTGYFPLRRSEDIFPAMLKNRIGIAPAGKTVWKAFHESGLQVNHRNPLRAAAIVLLSLNETGAK